MRPVRRRPRPAPGRRTRPHPRKGGSIRTVLLDDRGYVTLLKLYLARAGYTAGPLCRASTNGCGGPLSYDAAHPRWQTYCTQARIEIDIHQLCHTHATELINADVSIEAVRRHLGHASTETTQLYALLDDKVADAEIRRHPDLKSLPPRRSWIGDLQDQCRLGLMTRFLLASLSAWRPPPSRSLAGPGAAPRIAAPSLSSLVTAPPP
ncbi:tyrosine-type recombinase/integrase [Nonomuraea ceibae]|uniref:tyrosine-type recombinase/integrase n=1 Tax=Nonomuraea ceibae TaxID=1935170 RepID=UPI001C5FADAD|nr:site-specific integrase [Nonomuraea ceibae]